MLHETNHNSVDRRWSQTHSALSGNIKSGVTTRWDVNTDGVMSACPRPQSYSYFSLGWRNVHWEYSQRNVWNVWEIIKVQSGSSSAVLISTKYFYFALQLTSRKYCIFCLKLTNDSLDIIYYHSYCVFVKLFTVCGPFVSFLWVVVSFWHLLYSFVIYFCLFGSIWAFFQPGPHGIYFFTSS